MIRPSSIISRYLPALLFAFAFFPNPAKAATLDIGTDYRLRWVSLSRADYGLTDGQNYSYFSQRAQMHLGGRFSPNIELMTQFQALGVEGSSNSLTNPATNPAGNRYPNSNFQPWLQSAYLKATHIHDTPIDLTIGRQPITLGDGFILSDDDLGFTGVRAQSDLPMWGLRGDAFAFKVDNSLQASNGANIYGVEVTKPMHAVRYQVSFVNQQDTSGALYIRPSENASQFNPKYQALFPSGAPPINSQFNFNASNITRQFYDARMEGRLLEGGFYKIEGALQSGHVSRDPSLATSTAAALGYSPSVNLSGYGFLVSGGLFTRFSKYGPIEIHGTFGMASGDSGGSDDSSFHPEFAHRFDGLERSGFGEFYGATLYDAQPSFSYNSLASTPSVSGLPAGYSGLRVIGAGVTTHPTDLLSIGVDYYVYSAEETPSPTNFGLGSSDSSLGTELDIGAGFAYTSYLTFRGSFALFSPGAAYPNKSNATRILIEAIGRF
jgi:hypothetical protein